MSSDELFLMVRIEDLGRVGVPIVSHQINDLLMILYKEQEKNDGLYHSADTIAPTGLTKYLCAHWSVSQTGEFIRP